MLDKETEMRQAFPCHQVRMIPWAVYQNRCCAWSTHMYGIIYLTYHTPYGSVCKQSIIPTCCTSSNTSWYLMNFMQLTEMTHKPINFHILHTNTQTSHYRAQWLKFYQVVVNFRNLVVIHKTRHNSLLRSGRACFAFKWNCASIGQLVYINMVML